MSRDAYSVIDTSVSPPTVTFPAHYNVAVDLVHRHVAQGRGERIAVHDDEGRHSYAQLSDRIDRCAAVLHDLGVRAEQRVLLCLLDGLDFPTAFLAAMQLGAVPVPLNTMLTAADYEHVCIDSRAVLALVSEPLLPKFSKVVTPVIPIAKLRAGLAAATPRTEVFPTTPDDVAFWLYSSGSTGAPKGAMHLHSHPMLTAALYAQPVLGIREDDVVYSAARLFFAYGLGNALTFPFSVGATAALCSERPTPALSMKMIRERKATLFGGVPTLFAAMLNDPSLGRFDSLRRCLSAGEALPKDLGEKWKARTGTDILDGIGSTEMLHIFLSNRPDDVAYGTTGRPVPGYQLKLLGDDGDEVTTAEASGALWVRGPTAAIGYWNQRQKSLDTFHGPWTRTGDRYLRDAAGRFTYEGRADDMLKVGGIWVSPFEVESALCAHAQVLEAAVVGDVDEAGLTKPRAYVVLKVKTDACAELTVTLQHFVKQRLAPYKYPRWVEFVDELPKTATGKIQRFRLRASQGTSPSRGD